MASGGEGVLVWSMPKDKTFTSELYNEQRFMRNMSKTVLEAHKIFSVMCTLLEMRIFQLLCSAFRRHE